MKSIQYTIRNVPEPVDRLLRQQAKKRGQSFNKTLVTTLKQATGYTEPAKVFHDLDWFIGGKTIDKKSFDKSQAWLDSLPNEL